MGRWVLTPRILKLDRFITEEKVAVTLGRILGGHPNYFEFSAEEKRHSCCGESNPIRSRH
jgi:hypothetical protein